MGIFIAGGTSGLGLAIARRLSVSRPDAPVFLAYGSNEKAAAEAAEGFGDRANVKAIKVDITDAAAVRRAMEVVRASTGRLEVLVHSAVDRSSVGLLDVTPEEFRRTIDVNGTSLLYLVQAANDLLDGGSCVLFLSGRAAESVGPGAATGGAAGKAMGECLVRYLAVQLAPRFIRVNTLRSGPVDTPYLRHVVGIAQGDDFRAPPTLNGLPLEIEDVAAAAEFLASPAARMITGQIIMVDGGRSVLAASPKPPK